LELFDRVVAENGGVLYDPASQSRRLLGAPPPAAFVQDLQSSGVPLEIGEVIVATWHPHEGEVLKAIARHGLEYRVAFNKGAVMALPADLSKASGLRAALRDLHLSPRNTVAIGDAENDHTLFNASECAVAVANALAPVKLLADFVTTHDHGDGVVELIDALIADDLASRDPLLTRHDLMVARQIEGQPVMLSTWGENLLIVGTPGSGKSMLATSIVDQLIAHGYQSFVIDPEGDYDLHPDLVHLGTGDHRPMIETMIQNIEQSDNSVVVSLLHASFQHRPQVFSQLFPELCSLRREYGRPHWIVIDEAHHVLSHQPNNDIEAVSTLRGLLIVTVEVGMLPAHVLSSIDLLIVTGDEREAALATFAAATGRILPEGITASLTGGSGVAWRPASGTHPCILGPLPISAHHRRHRRKYAEGDLGLERGFVFRDPRGGLVAVASNLATFVELANNVPDDVWFDHLKRGDYSAWLRGTIADDECADAVAQIERNAHITAAESRELIRSAIDERYIPVV
jgi:hypothetical protein